MTGTTLLDRHDAVLLDLDGTVYHGARLIPGAVEAVAEVRRRGRAVRFVTNNAAKSASAVAEHLAALGVPAEAAEVSTSAQAAAVLLGQRLRQSSTVLVVGTESLAAEVRAVGLRTTRHHGPDVAAVLQGHSPDTAWADLAEACLAIRDGAWWVACNVDATLPSERGQLPGNGSMVAALRTASGREPDVAGKPQAHLLRTAADSAASEAALVVGDRLDTDIAGAVSSGLRSLVVLTGVATAATLLGAAPSERPDYLAADLSVLTDGSRVADLEFGPRPGWRVTERDGTVSVAVSETGGADRVELLRSLCPVVWTTGGAAIRAEDETAEAVLTAWGLA